MPKGNPISPAINPHTDIPIPDDVYVEEQYEDIRRYSPPPSLMRDPISLPARSLGFRCLIWRSVSFSMPAIVVQSQISA